MIVQNRCKLIEKIEHVIYRLANNNKQSVHELIVSSPIFDLWHSLSLQTLSFI